MVRKGNYKQNLCLIGTIGVSDHHLYLCLCSISISVPICRYLPITHQHIDAPTYKYIHMQIHTDISIDLYSEMFPHIGCVSMCGFVYMYIFQFFLPRESGSNDMPVIMSKLTTQILVPKYYSPIKTSRTQKIS